MSESDEALEQTAQRDCELPVPGGAQDQSGCGSEYPGLVEGSLAMAGGLGLDDLP